MGNIAKYQVNGMPYDLKDAKARADLAKETSERQQEIAVERARIDNLSTLEEGSTTGDAELADIRVGADGKTYSSAGNAVRGQIADLNSDLLQIYVDGTSLVINGGIPSGEDVSY